VEQYPSRGDLECVDVLMLGWALNDVWSKLLKDVVALQFNLKAPKAVSQRNDFPLHFVNSIKKPGDHFDAFEVYIEVIIKSRHAFESRQLILADVNLVADSYQLDEFGLVKCTHERQLDGIVPAEFAN
jgi:hypothetical protein